MRFNRLLLLPSLLAFGLSSIQTQAAPGDSSIEPTTAGPDFEAQGEYVGEGWATQVLAMGDGKFELIAWRNGLPGASESAEKLAPVQGVREGDKIVFSGEKVRGEILPGGVLSGTDKEGHAWKQQRVVRESSTAGAKPPAGAVVLFDGTNADAWVGGVMDERKLLKCGTVSKAAFGACTLHVEFRVPFMPKARGQGRGNSGVYLQDRFECQVLDSFGLSGENNETGGIYTISKPRLNMCFPPLSWQTYDIDFEPATFDAEGKKTANAIMSVRLNGVLVQDRVQVPHTTTSAGRKEGPEPGPIQLQNHGTPVFYRNIWILEKKAAQ